MTRSIELLHLTDLHLCARPQGMIQGWRVMETFDAVLSAAMARYAHADAIILGGDLVDDESRAGYAWLNRRLARCHKPVLAVAGNHEDPAAMQQEMRCAQVHGRLSLPGWQLLGLNSHRAIDDAGEIGAFGLAQLARWLACDSSPALVVLHHPPADTGSAWMDAIGLQDRTALAQLLDRHPHVRGLLCGHAHQEAGLLFAGRSCWITPSTMRQFLPGQTEFAEDSTARPGYRWLRLHADGAIETRVHRLHRGSPLRA